MHGPLRPENSDITTVPHTVHSNLDRGRCRTEINPSLISLLKADVRVGMPAPLKIVTLRLLLG